MQRITMPTNVILRLSSSHYYCDLTAKSKAVTTLYKFQGAALGVKIGLKIYNYSKNTSSHYNVLHGLFVQDILIIQRHKYSHAHNTLIPYLHYFKPMSMHV